MSVRRKALVVRARWDAETGTWWCANDTLPLATEAPTFDGLCERVRAIAPEIAFENGLVQVGGEIELRFVAERTQRAAVSSFA